MTNEQFDRLLEKLDWIGYELEESNRLTRDALNYPRDVRITEDRTRRD